MRDPEPQSPEHRQSLRGSSSDPNARDETTGECRWVNTLVAHTCSPLPRTGRLRRGESEAKREDETPEEEMYSHEGRQLAAKRPGGRTVAKQGPRRDQVGYVLKKYHFAYYHIYTAPF